MAFSPIALTTPQYEDFPNQFLKAFTQGTTTPLAMATDATGGTTAAKFQLDAQGFPITAGNVRLIPFIDGQYDLWLFPAAAEADANDTTNAIQFADNLNSDPLSETSPGYDKRYGPIFATIAAAIAANPVSIDGLEVVLVAGMTVSTQGYTTAGDVGSAVYLAKTSGDFGGTPDEVGDHTAANGIILVLQDTSPILGIKSVQYGILGDGIDNSAALSAAEAIATTRSVPLVLPSGDIGLTQTFTIARTGSDFTGFTMRGAGRNLTTFKRVSGTFTDMVEITVAGAFSLNNDLSGFGIDLAVADTGINGLKLNAGVWRSKFDDLYIVRDVTDKTGKGIFGGSATPADKGFFDNKFNRLYIANFDRNVHLQGTDLSGNTVTNPVISDSYIAGAATANVQVDFFNGYYQSGTQLEAHENDGILFGDGDSAMIMGGSIESPVAGAVGVNMNANTKSVVAFLDFFNNAGGNFIGNNKVGHMFKTAQSGIQLPAGGEIIVVSDGTNFSNLRFFEDAVADVKVRVSNGGNAISITNTGGTEAFKFEATSAQMEIINAAGFLRLQNGSDIRFLQSGVTTIDLMSSGSPEGVVTANSGSIYRNRSGGAGTTLFVKESGAGNTGWVGK